MAGIDILLAFAAATVAMALFPGPAVLYTIAQTLARGRRAGLMTVLGTHLGCYAHVAAAVLGASAVLRLVPAAYVALKIAGALYLIWLGIGMLRTRAERPDPPAIASRGSARAFLDSVIVQCLNPKVAFFFLAFLPQFADPAASLPVWAQLLVLGIAVNLAFSACDLLVVLSASALSRRLSRGSLAQRVLRAVGGSLMIGLGVKLAVDRS